MDKRLAEIVKLWIIKADNDFKTIVPLAEVDVEDFRIRFLSGAVKLLDIEVDKPVVNVEVM